jgi:predicted RNase H-like nuclease
MERLLVLWETSREVKKAGSRTTSTVTRRYSKDFGDAVYPGNLSKAVAFIEKKRAAGINARLAGRPEI